MRNLRTVEAFNKKHMIAIVISDRFLFFILFSFIKNIDVNNTKGSYANHINKRQVFRVQSLRDPHEIRNPPVDQQSMNSVPQSLLPSAFLITSAAYLYMPSNQ